jgi:hypothetical protein
LTLTLTILTILTVGDMGLRESICHARLACARQAQSLPELERKAKKATRRQNIWTQEELDLAEGRAAALAPVWFGEINRN